jgi:hypothetical protein
VTAGASTQDRIYESLLVKYGKPTTKKTRQLQNAYGGAKFVSVDATWDRGEALLVPIPGNRRQY